MAIAINCTAREHQYLFCVDADAMSNYQIINYLKHNVKDWRHISEISAIDSEGNNVIHLLFYPKEIEKYKSF